MNIKYVTVKLNYAAKQNWDPISPVLTNQKAENIFFLNGWTNCCTKWKELHGIYYFYMMNEIPKFTIDSNSLQFRIKIEVQGLDLGFGC